MTNLDSKGAYSDHLAGLERRLGRDEAFRQAIGGDFIAVGKLEHHLLRSLGLTAGHRVVDVGCGSGRLACQLASDKGIRYLGCDVVPGLLGYARELCQRPDWEFVATEGRSIPAKDGSADFVCFFSVFTHLLHEESFRYLREAARVLLPGGLVVLSFLEFRVPGHAAIFFASADDTQPGRHLNQLVDQDAIRAWAAAAGLSVDSIRGGETHHIPIPEEIVFENGDRQGTLGSFGQSVAVLRKR
ncbi:MAG TPA: class I SAM-dependent methyltransferase [Opitutaceae bacterium]|jgi:ubiquinone/menaquinone biosynthesis C-methylase UbiE